MIAKASTDKIDEPTLSHCHSKSSGKISGISSRIPTGPDQGPLLYQHILTRTLILLGLIFGGLSSCAARRPIKEYVLARSAVEAARRAQAARYAPGYWSQAEEAYMLARQYFKDSRFGDAKEQLDEAKSLAEKAEYRARLKRFHSGGQW